MALAELRQIRRNQFRNNPDEAMEMLLDELEDKEARIEANGGDLDEYRQYFTREDDYMHPMRDADMDYDDWNEDNEMNDEAYDSAWRELMQTSYGVNSLFLDRS